MRPRAMVKAGTTIAIGGAENENMLIQSKDKSGVLMLMSSADGKKLSEQPLSAVPVWDGMAVANGKLLLSLENGKLVCMGQQ